MKAQKIAKLAIAVAVIASTVTVARATTVALSVDPNLPPGTTAYVLGAANPGTPADAVDQTGFVNGILGLPLGGSGTVMAVSSSQTDSIYRSLNVFSGLPTSATSANNIGGSGNMTSISILAGYDFLVAKYDGQNGGTEVWFVGGLVGDTVTIPQNAFGDGNNQYGLSGTTLLEGSPSTPPVPDGGSTLALLGLGILSTLMFVRKVKTA